MEIELRLKVKGVEITMTPDEARDLVTELAKMTGQKVDPPTMAPIVIGRDRWPYYRPWPYRYDVTTTTDKWQTSWTSSAGDVELQARAVS